MQQRGSPQNNIAGAIVLLIMGFSGILGSSILSLLLIGAGFYLMFYTADQYARRRREDQTIDPNRYRSSEQRQRWDDQAWGEDEIPSVRWQPGQPVPARREAYPQVQTPLTNLPPPRRAPDTVMRPDGTYTHALNAARAAGIDPDTSPVVAADVGMMSFNEENTPELHRTHWIDDTSASIQPFVQVRVPVAAKGRVRFEITDSDGQTLFVHEDVHQLTPGMNLISPSARLRLHRGHATHGIWHLKISADGVTIADHGFGWMESSSSVLRRHLNDDGELSNELRQLMDATRVERLSLDDLLADQDDGDAAQENRDAASRRAGR